MALEVLRAPSEFNQIQNRAIHFNLQYGSILTIKLRIPLPLIKYRHIMINRHLKTISILTILLYKDCRSAPLALDPACG